MSSAHIATARYGGDLVGLARVVSDFALIVYLPDVLVHPDHHRRGVGRELVTRALSSFAGVRQKVLLTDSDPGQKQFYESLGYSDATESGGSDVRAL